MKTLYFLIVFLFFTPLVNAQKIFNDFSDEEDDIIDNLIYDHSMHDLLTYATSKNSISFNLQYNHNTYFSGREIGIPQYSLIPQVSYVHANGIFASVSGLYYERLSPNWDYTAITLGYGKRFSNDKKFWGSASFDWYFFSQPANNPFRYAVNTGFGMDNDKKTFGTDLSISFLFGDDESMQLVSSTYLEILLYRKKKQTFFLRPQLSLEMGQQAIQLARTIVFRGRTFRIVDPSDAFGFLNTQLKLPLLYSFANVDFEIGYVFNFPSPLKKEGALSPTNTFVFSLAYFFAF